MRLLLRQRFFSWFDSFDIYNDAGAPVYTVQGKLSWGHKLEISDASGRYRGTVQERVLTFLPQFELYEGETYLGCIRREFTFFRPSFTLDFRNWTVDGNWLGTMRPATARGRPGPRFPSRSSTGAKHPFWTSRGRRTRSTC